MSVRWAGNGLGVIWSSNFLIKQLSKLCLNVRIKNACILFAFMKVTWSVCVCVFVILYILIIIINGLILIFCSIKPLIVEEFKNIASKHH